MSKIVLFLISWLIAAAGYAQNTSGKVYSGDRRLAGVLVENRTQNKSTTTTDEGGFSIPARINDSLVFSAPFSETQFVVVEQYHLEDQWVVELKENLNELDEVLVASAPRMREFNIREYDSTFNEFIKADVKKNPHLYYPAGHSNGMDFIAIGKLILGLFKKDSPKEKKVYKPITYKQYEALFTKDGYFDQGFLNDQLQIPEQYQNLFYEYCDAKQLEGQLLLPDHQMDLVEALLILSKSFRAELSNFETEGILKPKDN